MYTKEQFAGNPFFDDIEMKYALDSLTNTFNRETATKYAKYLIEKEKPFMLCMCDIDNFKIVNDTKGHIVGDEILKTVADELMKLIGDRGIVGRYGGDEFLIIAEGVTEYDDAWTICHDINISLSDAKYPNVESLKITSTTGCARYPLDSCNYIELLGLADKALYRGKSKGRNCFIIYLASKHANIKINQGADYKKNSVDLHAQVFTTLTASDNLKKNLRDVINYISSYFMVDHICVQTDHKWYSVIHPLSRTKEFEIIPGNLMKQLLCANGYYAINNLESAENKYGNKLHNKLMNQLILSQACCQIKVYGKVYGYLRVDMVSSLRLWQTYEMDIFLTIARLLAILLDKYNLELDDILD